MPLLRAANNIAILAHQQGQVARVDYVPHFTVRIITETSRKNNRFNYYI
jgi:hypothetical protein